MFNSRFKQSAHILTYNHTKYTVYRKHIEKTNDKFIICLIFFPSHSLLVKLFRVLTPSLLHTSTQLSQPPPPPFPTMNDLLQRCVCVRACTSVCMCACQRLNWASYHDKSLVNEDSIVSLTHCVSCPISPTTPFPLPLPVSLRAPPLGC